MQGKTRPEPSRLAGPAPSAPPAAPIAWLSKIRSTTDPNHTIMTNNTIISQSPVGANCQEHKPGPAPSGLRDLAGDEDFYNPAHRGSQSGISELEQGVTDYEKFMRSFDLDPHPPYDTIISAQAEYEKLLRLEHHRTRAVTERLRAAEVAHSDELMQMKYSELERYNELKERHDRAVEEAKDYAYALRRLRLDEPTPAGPEVLTSDETANRTKFYQSAFTAESVEGDTKPRISKSTYLPDPERLDDGVNPTFESWLVDMRGKLMLNADHYPTELHKITYVACRTTGKAHMHLNARLSQDAVLPYTGAEDMFEDLKEMFNDESTEYRLEAMKTTDDFYPYLCKFLQSAGAQGRPYESLKFELGIHLTERLMTAVEPEFHDEFVTLGEFAMFCAEEANRLDLEREQGFSW